MSKERLEEIKEKYGLTDTDKLRAIYVSMAIKTEDLIWFKQQAEEKNQLEERVKELENQLEVTGNELSLVSEENQRYKQALEEIKNPNSTNDSVYHLSKIALEALQGGNDNE